MSYEGHTFEPSERLLDHDVNLALFGGRAEVKVRQRRRVFLASFLRERENDHRQERFLLQVAHQVNVECLIVIEP